MFLYRKVKLDKMIFKSKFIHAELLKIFEFFPFLDLFLEILKMALKMDIACTYKSIIHCRIFHCRGR